MQKTMDVERAAANLVALMKANGATCATAESCTGGGVGAAITSVPGASETFLGGVASYADSAKRDVLRVDGGIIERRGAVSGECAAAMACGARALFGADFAVSVTGIAGPGGGTPEKPVGLVWFAIASAAGVRTEKAIFPGSRDDVRNAAVLHAIGMLTAAAAQPPPSAAIRGCVFDFGGVMTSSRAPDRVRPAIAALGLPWDAVVKGFARYRSVMDGDGMTMEEMYSRIFADEGVEASPSAIARIVEEDRSSFLYRNERTLEWMRSLKARGFKIGILTNMPSSFAALFRKHFADYIALADAVVISGEAKLFKPKREIYALLRERIGLEAGELCFFDDVDANCDGARAGGWNAIRFDSNAQAERDFERLVRK